MTQSVKIKNGTAPYVIEISRRPRTGDKEFYEMSPIKLNPGEESSLISLWSDNEIVIREIGEYKKEENNDKQS